MANSVGEAAANALESGFRLAIDLNDRRRAQQRQDRMDEADAAERQRQIDRQQYSDKTAALAAQAGMLKEEGAALAARPMPPDEATMADYTGRVERVRAARQKHLGELTGYDFTADQKAGAQDIKDLEAGDFSKLQPGQLTRAISVATGRPPSDFMRANGQPAPLEQQFQAFQQAMQAGDQDGIVASANQLFAPDLRKRIGQPSRHGGTITGAQIVNILPAPNSTPEDPHVIPTLRIYVKSDDKNFKGPLPEGVPEGTTGWYDAPPTEGMQTGDNAKVRTIGIREAMDYVGKLGHLVEVLNKPEAVAQLDLDAKSPAFDPQRYFAALAQQGLAPTPKTTTKDTPIPKGGSVLRTTYDTQGKVVSERRIEGNPVPDKPQKRGALQQQLDAIDELEADGTLTPDEAEARKKAALARATTGTKAQGLAAGGGGGGGGGNDRKMNDKEIGRRLQYVKEQRLALDKKRDVIMAEYKADTRDASKKEAAELKKAMQSKIAALDEEDTKLRKNMDTLERQLDLGDGGEAPAPKLAARGQSGTLTKDAAAKRFGF